MKRSYKIALFVGAGIFFAIFSPELVKRFCNQDIPPSYVETDVDLVNWLGRPEWVMRHSSASEIYYEIGRNRSAILLILTGSSGSPSYTVDQAGRFIGWSPDSGEIAKPDQIHAGIFIRERVEVDHYLRDVWGKQGRK